jgi:hypothetical protein
VEYGDYECPDSRQAFREIECVEARLDTRFAFRHFPLTAIHPRATAAAAAAEAAALQGRFWEMHDVPGVVQGTPMLFVDGVVHTASYDAETPVRVLGG